MRTWFKPARPIVEPWRKPTGTDEILDVCFENRSGRFGLDGVDYPWPERERIKREARRRCTGISMEAFVNVMKHLLEEAESWMSDGRTTLGVLEMQDLAECGS